MLNDEFDVEIGEPPEYWELELLNTLDNDRRNITAAMETASTLPALPPSNEGNDSRIKKEKKKKTKTSPEFECRR